jgi:hypothetical protein
MAVADGRVKVFRVKCQCSIIKYHHIDPSLKQVVVSRLLRAAPRPRHKCDGVRFRHVVPSITAEQTEHQQPVHIAAVAAASIDCRHVLRETQ